MSENPTTNVAGNDTESSEDIGDAFGNGRNSASPSVGSSQTAPTALYATHYYKMNHPKRGVAVIFNHEIFDDLEPRSGTNVDCANLVNTLKNLGFEVHVHQNAVQKVVVKELERVASMDHTDHDCLVVAVLSHGGLRFLNARDTSYKTDSMWLYFTSDKCPTLAGKPKLFLIQACQGSNVDSGTKLKFRTEADGPKEDLEESPPTFRVLSHPDILIAYSTIPDFYSWRNEEHGGWFMQALYHELRENGTRYDMLTLLTFVSQRVAINFESNTPQNSTMDPKKQIPCITSTLTLLLKLSPPSNDTIIGNPGV